MEEEKRGYKAHVLILPYPAQGHINPMLQFAKRLVARGIKATLANTIFISRTMHADPNSSINVDTISDGYDEGGSAQAETVEAYQRNLREVGSKTLAEIIKKYNDSGHKFTALIYDGFLPWGLDVARQFGLIGAVFFTQSCAVNNIYYHVNRGLLLLPLSGPTVSIPGLPLLHPSDTPSYVHIYGSYPAFYDVNHVVVGQFSNVDEADWMLFNNFYKLEEQVVDWMSKLWRLRTIGPTLPSMYLDKRLEDDTDYGINLFKPDTSTCMSWLHDKPSGSVVYVSFGSMAEVEVDQMEEVAWGLKGSNYYFLWVVRASEESKLPKTFMGEISDKGLVVTWSPQLEVLAHASTGCFVTHCGFNSVLEALSLGVPMVAIPQWTDQGTNAKFVEDVWGVGIRARPDEKGIVRREDVELCVREIMEGEKGKEIKENAIKWRNLAKEAVDEGGSSDKAIDEFIADLVCS